MSRLRPDYLHVIVRTMSNRIRFELRLKKQEREALERLAAKRGITMSEVMAGYIERAAKAEKVWR